MGNTGSRGTGASSAAASAPVSVCYYELLSVDQTATPEEIKKAYRSKALQLHPDKNMHRVEEATELFSRIQNAYQVLSDPQERAFYDRHRESILRKTRSSQARVDEYVVDDLMAYFDTSAFSGYGDDPRGFFTIYRNLFSTLQDLEEDALFHESRRDAPSLNFVSFGSRNTPYDPSLRAFYDKFLHFASVRPFYEADHYDDRHAENRRHRRVIDKENQRLRDAMRREYNDAVRNLAAWVRKRDPRWHAYQKEREAQRKVAERARREETLRRQAELAEAYVAPDWAPDQQLDEAFLLEQLERLQFEELQSEVAARGAASPSNQPETDGECEPEDLYCIVCKKVFRTQKQWKNHEQSKKHQANMFKAGFVISDEADEADEDASDEDGDERDEDGDERDENGDERKDSTVPENAPSDGEHQEANHLPVEASTPPSTQSNSSHVEPGGQKPPKKKIRQKHLPATTPAQTPDTPQKTRPAKKSTATKADGDVLHCKVCGATFESRNRLFRHIEETGHAALQSAKSRGKK